MRNKKPLDEGEKGEREKKTKREQKPEVDNDADNISSMDPFQAMKGKAKKKKKLTIGEQLAQTHARSHETQGEMQRVANIGG